jgi:hypothetical protein
LTRKKQYHSSKILKIFTKMKCFLYNLNKTDVDIFFPNELIKSKIQIIKILLEFVRGILLYRETIEGRDIKSPYVKLIIDKKSRIFFFNERKYYTIHFPFNCLIQEGSLEITYQGYRNIIPIESGIISGVMEILKNEEFNSSSASDFIKPICHIESEIYDNIWELLKGLLMFEDGYVRFDSDPEEYKRAKNEGREHTHPENHIDVFYNNGNTFKLGLKRKSTPDEFIDYFNSKTDCKYLKNY